MQILVDSEYQMERAVQVDDAVSIQAVKIGRTDQTVTIRVADAGLVRRYQFRVMDAQVDVEPFTEEDRKATIKRLRAELRELTRGQ